MPIPRGPHLLLQSPARSLLFQTELKILLSLSYPEGGKEPLERGLKVLGYTRDRPCQWLLLSPCSVWARELSSHLSLQRARFWNAPKEGREGDHELEPVVFIRDGLSGEPGCVGTPDSQFEAPARERMRKATEGLRTVRL